MNLILLHRGSLISLLLTNSTSIGIKENNSIHMRCCILVSILFISCLIPFPQFYLFPNLNIQKDFICLICLNEIGTNMVHLQQPHMASLGPFTDYSKSAAAASAFIFVKTAIKVVYLIVIISQKTCNNSHARTSYP